MIFSRRGALLGGATLALQACSGSSIPLLSDQESSEDQENSVDLTPQFRIGRDSSERFTELGFSLHCDASREYFREEIPALRASIRNGEMLAIFSHVVRTDNELPLGVTLLQVGGEAYSEAVLAVMGLSIQLERSVSAAEARQFLQAAGFPTDPNINEGDASAMLVAMRMVYESGLGAGGTPYIRTGRIG